MKVKRYSESIIKTTQKFLSNYGIAFESLDEKQKGIVTNYAYARKYLGLCLFVLIFALIVCSLGAYLSYNHSLSTIGYIVETSSANENINLDMHGKLILLQGFLIGILAWTGFYILIISALLPFILKFRRQTFDAFLPALKQTIDNETNTSD